MTPLRLIIPVLVVLLFGSAASAQDAAPLTNWAAPIYWNPWTNDEAPLHGHQPVALSPKYLVTGTPTPLPFVAITPCRLIDTRSVGGSGITGEWGPPSLVAGLPTDPPSLDRVFTFTGAPHCTIPVGAQAVSAYITTINYTGNGHIRAYPAGAATRPFVATLNFRTAAGIGVTGEVIPLSSSGQVSVYSIPGTDLIVDLNGYYSPTGIVNSLNTLYGDLAITGGNNVTITPLGGQTLSISAAMPSGAAVFGKPGDTTLVSQGFTEIVTMDREVWAPTSLTNVPSGRFWHCSVWTGTKMFIWGGQDSDQVPRTVTGGLYDPATDSWTATSMGTGVPTARRYHRCVWTGSEALVWGGEDASLVALNSGSRYNPVGNSWTAMTTTGAPAGRFSAAVVWAAEASPPRMLIWGGVDRFTGSNVYPAAGGAYNPADDTWSPINTTSQPTPRASPAFAWTGTKLVLWGGYIGTGTVLNDGGRFDPSSDTWTATAATTLAARYTPSTIWTGSRMIVFSGFVGGAPPYVTNTGGIYDPSSDKWRTMTTTNAPAANYGYTGHWTGLPLSEMVVWGGYSSAGGNYRTLSLFIKN